MPTDKELMQQALNALEHLQTDIEWQYKSPTRTMLRKVEKALRARLAQPEPEPLWIRNREGKLELHAAQKKEWAGLTDEEIKAIRVSRGDPLALHIEFARAIEAKLKEKNT